jgi:cytochrome c553
MKNVIVVSLTAIVFMLMAFVAMDDAVYQGGEHARVIEDFGDKTSNNATVIQPKEKTDREKENDKIRALQEKAGSNKEFKVSLEYKQKCSSCHGVTGSGYQSGRKMMGPAVFGQSEADLYKKLSDFKAGRTENLIMKGLLIKNTDEDLKRLAKEISEFKARAAAVK